MPDPSATPRLWRFSAPPSPGAGRRTRLLFVLAVLTAFAGVVIGLLYWVSPPRPVAVLPVAITIGPVESGAVPWAERDRAALAASDLLGQAIDDPSANPSRDQIRLRFAALAKTAHLQPIVISLSAPAAVDAGGTVFLLPADPTGDNPRNRLTLVELLAAVRDCPAHNKLLVLNLVPPSGDPLYAPPAGNLSTAVFAALDAVPDDNRLCLVACGPGQAPHTSAELGRSVFSYYLEAGLRGTADDDRDGRVTVSELANFVRVRVNRWSSENRGPAQTPILVGGAKDFTLRAIPAGHVPEEHALNEVAYPDWLKASWEAHDRWRTDGRATTAPWAFRQARSALLSAERDIQAGLPAEDVKHKLTLALAHAEQAGKTLRTVPTPDPLPTLAAMFPGYAIPEPALLEQLRTAAVTAESRPAPAPTKPDEKPTEPPFPADFEAFKTKPHPLLAAVVFRVLSEDADPSPARIRNFAKLLAAQDPQVRFAEVLLIRRLAALADQGALAPWANERAALALQTARWIEDTATRPDVLTWAKPALDEAYSLRANAEAVLFAPGFASPDDATTRLRTAEATARKLKLTADRLQSASAIRDDAALWLTGVTPLVNSGAVNITEAVTVADAVGKLNHMLMPAPGQTGHTFADRVPEWDRLANSVRVALSTANRPFTPEALGALRRRAEGPNAGPPIYTELDTALASPLVPAADRVALWSARSALARRLCENTLRKDAADNEAAQKGEPRALTPDLANEAPHDTDLAKRRSRWAGAILRTAVPGDRTEDELLRLAPDRFAFADRLRRVWSEDVPTRLLQSAPDRTAAVWPTSVASPKLDDATTNPHTAQQREAALRMWAWHAARFEYELRDPVDPSPAITGVPFTTTAARSCATAAKTGGFAYLELAHPSVPKLTFENPSADLKIHLRSIGTPTTACVQVLSPATEWLKPSPAASAQLEVIRDSVLSLPLAAGSKPTSHPTALGVLVEATAELGGETRTYHRRVPVSLRTLSSRVDLLVRADPKAAPQQLTEFRVRPNGQPSSYQLVLFNPSPVPQKIAARLVGLNRETVPINLEPGKPLPLVFTSTAPPPPPLAPGAVAKPDDGFAPISGNALALELFDPTDKDVVLQTFTLPVVVADPASYLRVSDAVFTPAVDGRLNRLSATIVPGDIPGSGACPVKLLFPPEANPKLLVRDGSQAGSIATAGKPVTLYVENIAFPFPTGAKVTVTLSADGVERVATYSATLPTLGETVRLQLQTSPRVRVKALDYASGTVPLPVALEVDNAPEGARLELLVGTAKDAASPVNADRTFLIATARQKLARLRFDPKGEGFELVGSIADHKSVLPVDLLTGKRTLEARLIAPDGDVVTKDRVTVVFDGNVPTDVKFLNLPPKAAKGQPLAVKATCGPSISGIKKVEFFVGKPNKDELPTSPTPMPGVSPDGSEWRATLQMPDQKGIVVVGVKFTSQAGLSTIEAQEIELLDAAELNRPAPGKIAGKLVENRIPQPTAVVFLYDAKGNPLAKATTKADGSFEFKELVPGTYYLFSEKERTNRQVKEQVDVKAGELTAKDLELLLK